MPNNWKKYKLEEISKNVAYGYTASASKENVGPKFLRITDIQNNFISWENVPYCKIKDNDLKKNKLEIGDIVVARTGNSTGATACVKDQIDAVFASYLIRFRIDENIANPFYIDFILRSQSWKNYVEAVKGGSAQPGANAKQFGAFELLLPSVQEQQSIASILSAIDDKIENNLAINKTLEEMAMALYKHWFVDFGPFQDGEFIESELGLIPKGWEVKNVKYFGEVITGKTPEKKHPEHFGDIIPFVTPTDFKDYGKHIVNANRYISDLGINKLKKNILPVNSVVITCIGSDMGKIAISKVECLTNQQINSLKTEYFLYMYCFFKSKYSLLKRMAGDGTTMPIINKSSFENIKVLYPSVSIINEFEKLIGDYDNQILINTNENQSLTQLRDTLLPQLISGTERLKEFREKEV